MGVFLCSGQSIHTLHHSGALHIDAFELLQEIRDSITNYGNIFLFLGKGSLRIEKKRSGTDCFLVFGRQNPILCIKR